MGQNRGGAGRQENSINYTHQEKKKKVPYLYRCTSSKSAIPPLENTGTGSAFFICRIAFQLHEAVSRPFCSFVLP